ncbi:hypothetical protein Taro_027162 [Colocasia esculenta]|uniref:Uncharacterized protein n=1 Tax=Colocasia esculenta TaxID=4460 RepID=A0A843V812_COLES|nr:hypothetical protein [Colocasia esculenta]
MPVEEIAMPSRVNSQLARQKSPQGGRFAILQSMEDGVVQEPSEIVVREQPSSSKHTAADMELCATDLVSLHQLVPLGGLDPGPSQSIEPVIADGGFLHSQVLEAKKIVDMPKVFEAGKVVADRAQLDNSLMQTCGLGRGVRSMRVDKEGVVLEIDRGMPR